MHKAFRFRQSIVFLWIFSLPLFVFAAPLTYTSNTNLTIASPATTFVIASGSVADTITLNATSVVVSLSNATGGSFTLTASSSDLSLSASAGGGSDPTSCTNGVASTTISQSTGSAIYTIVPTGIQCVPQSSSPSPSSTSSVSGSTVGVPAGYNTGIPSNYILNQASSGVILTPPVQSQVVTTNPSLETVLAGLEAQLQSLLQEAKKNGISIPGITSPSSFHFARNLKMGNSGADVNALQKLLISQHIGPAAEALAIHGATDFFGTLTLKALQEYQKHIGLPATGFLGPLTRGYLQAHS